MPPTDRTTEFLHLLGQCEENVRAFILAIMPHWADAEDVAQEVRIRLWQQFDSYDPTEDFAAWARTVAYYRVLTHREKLSRRRELLQPDFLEAVAREVSASSCDLHRRRALLTRCLGRLREELRGVLLQWYGGKESTRQIAARLGRSFDATRQSILRARNIVAKCVEENSPASGDRS